MVRRISDRSGKGVLGCLLPIVGVGIVFYLAILFGTPWFKNEQFLDEMSNVAGFEGAISDSAKTSRILARADSLKLPVAAKNNLQIRRLSSPPRLVIKSEYTITVTVPFLGDKVLTFTPKIEEEI